MKRNALLLLSQLISVNIWAQSVYMHEAQEESEGTNIFDTLLGFAIFASIIWLISKISENYNNKKKAQREKEWELEIKRKVEEDREREKQRKIERDRFVQTLICKNTVEVGGFDAVD